MSKRHRHNLARLNKVRPWMFTDRTMAEQSERHRKAYRTAKEARTLDNATGSDALTGHALNVAVIECMTIHVQPPVPFPDMQDAEFLDGKTFDEIVNDEALKAAWEKRYHAATLAWRDAYSKTEGVTWGWLKYQKVDAIQPVSMPSYAVLDDMVCTSMPGDNWRVFNPAGDYADVMKVFEAGAHDIHGAGNLSWDADCFDRPEWHCAFSGGWGGWGVDIAGINGWGDTTHEAICRAYVYKQTTWQELVDAHIEATREQREKDMRILSDW